MTTCRECRKSVSDQAAVCPHCGVDQPGWRDPSTIKPLPPRAPDWQPGDPYPDDVIPTAVMTKGLFGMPRRAGAFRVGNRVRCELPDEGVGVIIGISDQLEHSMGTKLYPSFLVEFADGQRHWYKGISMTKVKR
jgi:hypothetical protein